MITAKQQLLELKYDGDLSADIAAALNAGTSWRQIRKSVEERTGLQVSHQTLYNWYAPKQTAA